MSEDAHTKPVVDAAEKKKATLRVLIIDIAAFVMSIVMITVKNYTVNQVIPEIPGLVVGLMVVTIALVVLAIISSYKASSKKLLSTWVTVVDIILTVIAIWNIISILRYLEFFPF